MNRYCTLRVMKPTEPRHGSGPVKPVVSSGLSARRARGCLAVFAVVAQVAAGQRDEDIFQADVPRRQAGQRPLEPVDLFEHAGMRGAAARRSRR